MMVAKCRILSIIDKASREYMAPAVARELKSDDALAALAELFVTRGRPRTSGPTMARSLSPRRCRSSWRRSA
jgi:hypothetical protein